MSVIMLEQVRQVLVLDNNSVNSQLFATDNFKDKHLTLNKNRRLILYHQNKWKIVIGNVTILIVCLKSNYTNNVTGIIENS